MQNFGQIHPVISEKMKMWKTKMATWQPYWISDRHHSNLHIASINFAKVPWINMPCADMEKKIVKDLLNPNTILSPGPTQGLLDQKFSWIWIFLIMPFILLCYMPMFAKKEIRPNFRNPRWPPGCHVGYLINMNVMNKSKLPRFELSTCKISAKSGIELIPIWSRWACFRWSILIKEFRVHCVGLLKVCCVCIHLYWYI